MKKPEPWPVTTSLPPGAFGPPNLRKNRSNGEPGGNGMSSSVRAELAERSNLTRTEITEGLTFSTMSAKPTGRCGSCWTLSVRFCASADVPNRSACRAKTNTAAAKPATVVASSAKRRADSVERGRLLCITVSKSLRRPATDGAPARLCAAPRNGQPDRLLSAELKLCNVSFGKIITQNQILAKTTSGDFSARERN